MQIDILNPNGVPEPERLAHAKLEPALPNHWHAYASLQMLDRRQGPSEIDLIIVNDFQILVVELKQISGKLTSDGYFWYKNGQKLYESPVSKNELKAKKLNAKINDKISDQLSYKPYVNSCVVIYEKNDPSNMVGRRLDTSGLTDDERQYVIHLDDFLEIGSQKKYDQFFKLRNKEKNLQDNEKPTSKIKIWNSFFNKSKYDFVGKERSSHNYSLEKTPIWQHPNGIYSEFHGHLKTDKNHQALVRSWDFHNKSIASEANSHDQRSLIANREYSVIGYIDSTDPELESIHLSPIARDDEVSAEFSELYKWPRNLDRLDEFVAKNKLKVTQKKELLKVLISQASRLHQINVSHRDFGPHSIWVGLPSKIVFSNFCVSTFPNDDRKTVKSYRKIIQALNAPLPEELIDDSDATQYSRDVYLLAACAHFIVYESWPSLDKDGLYIWQEKDSDPLNGALAGWFKKSFEIDASRRFANLFDALNEINALLFEKDHEENKTYSQINEAYLIDTNPWIKFSGEVLKTEGNLTFLRLSDGSAGVRIWSGISHLNAEGSNFKLAMYLQKIQSIKSSGLKILPEILEFGFNPNLMTLVIAYKWIEGEPLGNLQEKLSESNAKNVIQKLITNIIQLHQYGFSHGDIHPLNIIVNEVSFDITFIDCFEYDEKEGVNYCPAFSPNNYESLSKESKDRYGITKIINDISEKNNLNALSSYSKKLLDQTEITSNDFDRLSNNIHELLNPREQEKVKCFPIHFPRLFQDFKHGQKLTSDNNIFFVNIKQNPKQKSERLVDLIITGINSEIKLTIQIDTNDISRARLDEINHSDYVRKKLSSSIEISGEILLQQSQSPIAKELIKDIVNKDQYKNFIRELNDNQTSGYREKISLKPKGDFAIKSLWKTMILAEEYASLECIVTDHAQQFKNQTILPIEVDLRGTDLDPRNDEIVLKYPPDVFNGRQIGIVSEIDKKYLRLSGQNKTNKLKQGDKLRLDSVRSLSSLNKRKKASEALLAGRALIPNLFDYFDIKNTIQPQDFDSSITDDDFKVYDEYDKEGNLIFSLNQQQRTAFINIIQKGPVSLLQGPPGTGKTAFISSICHYLINKSESRILLLSQSHEAVNNAAEKVKKLFSAQGEPLSIVRLGSDQNTSLPLKEDHEQSIQDHYRETFRSEFNLRTKNVSSALGINPLFVEDALNYNFSYGKSLSKPSVLLTPLNELEGKEKHDVERAIEFLKNTFSIEDFSPVNAKEINEAFYECIMKKHDIRNPKSVKKLQGIIKLGSEWIKVLTSGRSKFQNYLAKTRQLVCGTCVGISNADYGISENKYDWVIIDEAARASASELAIGMLVGRRLLLVGDHKQLGAVYTKDHINECMKKLDHVPKSEFYRSDFERAFLSNYGKECGQTLTTQYRMASEIGNLVSNCFYSNQLTNGKSSNETWIGSIPGDLGTTLTWIDTSDSGIRSQEDRRASQESTSYTNKYEVEIIYSLIDAINNLDSFQEKLMSHDGQDAIVGIICTYKEQSREVRRQIQRHPWSMALLEKNVIKVDTVDSYQGKENEIIILSMVRNNDRGELGFLGGHDHSSEQRVNVAISRAKERLYIVGSLKHFSSNTDAPASRVAKYIQENNSENISIMKSLKLLRSH